MVTSTDNAERHLDALSWASVQRSPRVWGLDAASFHLAWWRSQGVQWIARGAGRESTREADLYLLTEPSHLVVFDLSPLVPALTWNCPSVTRLRIVSSSGDDYREVVERGPTQSVVRVRREYRSRQFGSQRVFLTADPQVADLWSTCSDRRSWTLALRANGKWARSDHHRIGGESFRLGDPSDEGRCLTDLLSKWPDVDRVVQGIEQVADGVWMRAGETLHASDVAVGPAWIGDRSDSSDPLRVIGPMWVSDDENDLGSEAPLREFDDVPPAQPSTSRAAESQPTGFDVGKRVFDLMVASIGLLILSPLFVLVAIAVLIDSGWPVFFGHERQSIGGRPFKCLKFRTMRMGAERLVKDFADRNVCDGPQVFIADDPRVTRIGRVLRRFHLDELPQLINVLWGDMSLVGPRPSPERENRMCPAWRDVRLSVRPGITGLWQVRRTRQPGLDFQEWIKFDMEYVSRRNWKLDLWIVLQTVRDMIFGTRADARATIESNAD